MPSASPHRPAIAQYVQKSPATASQLIIQIIRQICRIVLPTSTDSCPANLVSAPAKADPMAFTTPKQIIAYPIFEMPQPQATNPAVKSTLTNA